MVLLRRALRWLQGGMLTLSLDACGGRVVYLDEDPPSIDCSGSFEKPIEVFDEGNLYPQALSPTSDGLELFYVRSEVDEERNPVGPRLPTVRSRPTIDAPFGPARELVELRTVCRDRFSGLDLTGFDMAANPLRIYISCGSYTEPKEGPLLVAERKDRQSPFLVSVDSVGSLAFSIGITDDELTVFGTLPQERPPTLDQNEAVPVDLLVYRRNSINEVFGPGQLVKGVDLRNPEPLPTNDGLLGVDVRGTGHMVSMAIDSSAPLFHPPDSKGYPYPPYGESDRSPAISADCRTLYFTRRGITDRVLMARR